METNNKGCQEVKNVTNKKGDAKFAPSPKMSKQSRERLCLKYLAPGCCLLNGSVAISLSLFGHPRASPALVCTSVKVILDVLHTYTYMFFILIHICV